MPFYEYQCRSCKFYMEEMQKISDPPLVKCPSCGKPTLQKLVSAPVFRLKGSGWYETDFKSDKESKHNLADRREPKPAEESKADKSETKPAAPEAVAKPAESKTPSVTTSAAPSVSTGSRHRSAAAQKRPAVSKASTRSSARPKAKPAARARTARRGSKG